MAKLKVFRTTIGFHDAYVATPSRAAALRAWGATTDLFAMGAAEEVAQEALMAKPLAAPGAIIDTVTAQPLRRRRRLLKRARAGESFDGRSRMVLSVLRCRNVH